MLNIERSTSITILTSSFTDNWLIENGCSDDRSLTFSVNYFAGNMVIKTLSVTNYVGPGAAASYLKTVLNINAAQALSNN